MSANKEFRTKVLPEQAKAIYDEIPYEDRNIHELHRRMTHMSMSVSTATLYAWKRQGWVSTSRQKANKVKKIDRAQHGLARADIDANFLNGVRLVLEGKTNGDLLQATIRELFINVNLLLHKTQNRADDLLMRDPMGLAAVIRAISIIVDDGYDLLRQSVAISNRADMIQQLRNGAIEETPPPPPPPDLGGLPVPVVPPETYNAFLDDTMAKLAARKLPPGHRTRVDLDLKPEGGGNGRLN